MTSPNGSAIVHRLAIGDAEIAVEERRGPGVPLLLVHGFPFDRRMWRGQQSGLAPRRLLLPDLRGHGESEPGPPPYSMVRLAEDLRQIMDHFALDQVVLAGLSMGGYVALAFALRYPERLRALMLLDTQAGADTPEVRGARADQSARVRRDGVAAIADQLLDRLVGGRQVDPATIELTREMILGTSTDGVVGALEGMAARPDVRPMLAAISCPTLILVGSDDNVTPPKLAREMAAAIPNADLVEIPGAGHLAPLEQPETVNAAIERFLGAHRL